jgi:hypothetical protein
LRRLAGNTVNQLKLLPISRVENISSGDFRRLYMEPNLPVIIKNMATSWPAFAKWTPEYFARNFGSTPVKVYNASFAQPGMSYMSNVKTVPFKEYLDLMTTTAMDLRMFAFNVSWRLPALKEDILFPEVMQGFSKKFIFMFFGCKGSITPMHYDPDLRYLLHTVFHGKKRVVMFANEESRNLYKHPFNSRSYVDVDHPDFDKFPRLTNVTGYQETLQPGETLFIPSGYWHYMIYEEAGFAICTRRSHLSWVKRIKGYVNILVLFPIDKLMNKLFPARWFRWKEQRSFR